MSHPMIQLLNRQMLPQPQRLLLLLPLQLLLPLLQPLQQRMPLQPLSGLFSPPLRQLIQ